ncbi:hypothetical protein LJR221_001493 [Agrobacterium tumefaciens]
MTNKTPSTVPEWLIFAADKADQYPLDMLTSAGNELQRAFSTFLRDGGKSQADLLDLHADLLTLIPRLMNATVTANHQGAPCVSCSKDLAVTLATEILRDAVEHAKLQKKSGGIH